MKKFYKHENIYWELKSEKGYNIYGETHDVKLDEVEIIEAKDFHHLNWKKTPVLDDKYETGWLSPEAKFYGCDDAYHSLQSFYIHKESDEINLERKGWVKIFTDFNGELTWYTIKPRANPKQLKWLSKNNFDTKDEFSGVKIQTK